MSRGPGHTQREVLRLLADKPVPVSVIAAGVYGTAEPTAAQLASTRRAVLALERAGQAVTKRMPGPKQYERPGTSGVRVAELHASLPPRSTAADTETTMSVNAQTRLLALQAAHDAGRDDLAIMLLSGRCRAYTLSDRSAQGYVINDWDRPVPPGTQVAIWVDTTGRQPVFYVVPVADLMEMMRVMATSGTKPRPRTPESHNCRLTAADLAPFEGAWGSA